MIINWVCSYWNALGGHLLEMIILGVWLQGDELSVQVLIVLECPIARGYIIIVGINYWKED